MIGTHIYMNENKYLYLTLQHFILEVKNQAHCLLLIGCFVLPKVSALKKLQNTPVKFMRKWHIFMIELKSLMKLSAQDLF